MYIGLVKNNYWSHVLVEISCRVYLMQPKKLIKECANYAHCKWLILKRSWPREVSTTKFSEVHSVCDLSNKGGGRVREYMHARGSYNVLKQDRTVQKGGSSPLNPPVNHTLGTLERGKEDTVFLDFIYTSFILRCGNTVNWKGEHCLDSLLTHVKITISNLSRISYWKIGI